MRNNVALLLAVAVLLGFTGLDAVAGPAGQEPNGQRAGGAPPPQRSPRYDFAFRFDPETSVVQVLPSRAAINDKFTFYAQCTDCGYGNCATVKTRTIEVVLTVKAGQSVAAGYGVYDLTHSNYTVLPSGVTYNPADRGALTQGQTLTITFSGEVIVCNSTFNLYFSLCDYPPLDPHWSRDTNYPFFSEYVEGSSNNKALEIFNPSLNSLQLSTCTIRHYNGGSSTPTYSYTLASGTLDPGDVHVVCDDEAGTGLLAFCDESTNSAALGFNGDDTLALYCGATVDVIGQIGYDPGSEWGSGDCSTQNNTIRRKCGLVTGDTNGSDAFVPSVEWEGFTQDTFTGLGTHVYLCE